MMYLAPPRHVFIAALLPLLACAGDPDSRTDTPDTDGDTAHVDTDAPDADAPDADDTRDRADTPDTGDDADVTPDPGFELPEYNPGSDAIPGTVFHVAIDGDDSADGSLASPWATMAHALTQVTAGDAIAMHAGTYAERVTVTVSGTPDAYLTIMAWEDDEVVIDGEGISLDGGVGRWVRGMVHVHEASYVRVQGLRVIHAADNGFAATVADHIVFEDCETYDTVSSGIGIWSSNAVDVIGNRVELACNNGGQECITVAGSSDGVLLLANEVFNGGPGDSGGEGIDIKGGGELRDTPEGRPEGPRHVYVVGNDVHDIHRGCFYADAWDADVGPILFHGNRGTNCDGFGVAAAGESGGLLHDVTFTHNVLVRGTDQPADFGGTGAAFAYNWGSATAELDHITVAHNTFFNMRWGCGAINADTPVAGVQEAIAFENNLCINAAGGVFDTDESDNEAVPLSTFPRVRHNLLWFVDPSYEAASYYADPVFMGADAIYADPLVAATEGTPRPVDLIPGVGSPAIGAGVSIDEAPAVDHLGAPQSTPPTIGALVSDSTP